jgi:hypothetical protein
MKDTKVVMECGHCGEHAECKLRGKYSEDSSEENCWYDVTEWSLLECIKCHRPTLKQTRNTVNLDGSLGPNYEDFPEDGRIVHKEKILYPLGTRLDNLNPYVTALTTIPKDIEINYKAALLWRGKDPNTCGMYVGRTLEAICKHEGAKGVKLADKLNDLSNRGRIPKTISQMARQSRLIRNMSVHIEGRVTYVDVLLVLEFLEVILEYLYVLPSKVAEVEERLQEKNSFSTDHEET